MSDRKPVIAGNWKMHYTHLEAIQVVQKLSYQLNDKDYERADVVVCPPFTALRSVQTTLDSDRIPLQLGAQNCHWEEKGAFTGEVSPGMLAKLTVKWVIVGHSERREYFAETDETVNRKIKAVIKAGLTPIVCVGESLERRESGGTDEWVRDQITYGFVNVKKADALACVVAYEPIWAIGTGRTATSEQANETIGVIRGALRDLYGDTTAGGIRILYGGSVKPSNIAELMGMPEIDGALVGGASLDPDDFAKLVKWDD